jgi:MFS family permease
MKLAFSKNLAVLSFAMVVVMLGFGMVIPIFPFYIERLGAGGSAFGLLVAIAAFTELVFGPFWGSLSDRTGRKPILIVGMFGFGLAMLLFGLSTELWMLFVFRALSGILSSATVSPAMAYIGDSTSELGSGGRPGANPRPSPRGAAGRRVAGDAVLHIRRPFPGCRLAARAAASRVTAARIPQDRRPRRDRQLQ